MKSFILGLFLPALSFVISCTEQGPNQTSEIAPTTYFDHVGNILNNRCVSCHREGGIAPFALETYEQAKKYAPSIVGATQVRTMPPWGVDESGACNTFKNSRWLTDKELDLFARWNDEGSLQGENTQLNPSPEPLGISNPDANLDIGLDYTPTGNTQHPDDDYHCFIVALNPVINQDMFLTAFEVKPDNATMVHHVIVYSLDNVTQENQAMTNDDGENGTGTGYTCFGGSGVEGSRFLGGWAPGVRVTEYPQDTGIKIFANRKLVVQIHYNLSAGTGPDRTSIDLKLENSVASEADILALADLDMALAPNQPYVTTETSIPIPTVLTVHGVFPHMHTLGVDLNVKRIRNSVETCMVDVPRWDFEWQQFYFYETPLSIALGDTIRLTCGYNTTGRDTPVTWGEGTSDEMCLNFFYVTH